MRDSAKRTCLSEIRPGNKPQGLDNAYLKDRERDAPALETESRNALDKANFALNLCSYWMSPDIYWETERQSAILHVEGQITTWE
jgi:hypothetical protein